MPTPTTVMFRFYGHRLLLVLLAATLSTPLINPSRRRLIFSILFWRTPTTLQVSIVAPYFGRKKGPSTVASRGPLQYRDCDLSVIIFGVCSVQKSLAPTNANTTASSPSLRSPPAVAKVELGQILNLLPCFLCMGKPTIASSTCKRNITT